MSQAGESRQHPLQVFVSYSHKDYKFSKELCDSLASLRRQGLIDVWWDERISAGDEHHSVIRRELESADVVVFLISAACIASDYVMNVEFPLAVQRKAAGIEIIPLVVRDVDYEGTEFRDLNPRVKVEQQLRAIERWKLRATAWAAITKEIRELAESRTNHGPLVAEQRAGETSTALRRPGLPPRRELTGRAEVIDFLASALRWREDGGVVALVGSGGIGKTTIAVEYAWRYLSDYDRVVWLGAESAATLAWDCGRTAAELQIPALDESDARAGLRQWLATNDRWLVVFDNATDPSAVEALLPPSVRGHVVITSREDGWSAIATEIRVDQLPPVQAADLLMSLTGDRDHPAAIELAELLNGLPLALKDAAAAMHEQQLSLRGYLDANASRLVAEKAR